MFAVYASGKWCFRPAFHIQTRIIYTTDGTWEKIEMTLTRKRKIAARRTNERYTSVKIIKNEVGCRDDTVPKTVETRRHCEED